MRTLFMMLFCIAFLDDSIAQPRPWFTGLGGPDHNRYYPPGKQVPLSTDFVEQKFALSSLPEQGIFIGDVRGDGEAYLVFADPSNTGIQAVRISDGEAFWVPVLPHQRHAETQNISLVINGLYDIDSQPGLEVVCSIVDANSPAEGVVSFFQIVSFASESVLNSFYGFEESDVDGDGFWRGREILLHVFQTPGRVWKLLTNRTAEHADYKPRALAMYDIASGQPEGQFDMATPVAGVSLMEYQNDILLLVAPFTPDNWIREIRGGEPLRDENGDVINVSEVVGGDLVFDDEAWDVALRIDESGEQAEFNFLWKHKRGELMSGWSSMYVEPNGNPVGVVTQPYIRDWEAIAAGGILFYDMQTGQVTHEYYPEITLAYSQVMTDPPNDQVVAVVNEEARLALIHRTEGLVAEHALDPVFQSRAFHLVGVANVDGGTGVEYVVQRNSTQQEPALLIFDESLQLKYEIPGARTRLSALNDFDEDGYAEIYLVESTEDEIPVIRQIEFEEVQSSVVTFELYP